MIGCQLLWLHFNQLVAISCTLVAALLEATLSRPQRIWSRYRGAASTTLGACIVIDTSETFDCRRPGPCRQRTASHSASFPFVKCS